MSTKAMSSAEKIREKAASCLHVSSYPPDFLHRAKAREGEAAKRIRACTAAKHIFKEEKDYGSGRNKA